MRLQCSGQLGRPSFQQLALRYRQLKANGDAALAQSRRLGEVATIMGKRHMQEKQCIWSASQCGEKEECEVDGGRVVE